jgi:hypothetical protein
MRALPRRVSLPGILLTLAVPFGFVAAQKAPPPDSVLVRILSPSLVRVLDDEIARAALGQQHVLTFDLPSPATWSGVVAHLMAATKGRAPTTRDSSYLAVSIRDIRFEADTLIVTFAKEWRDLCPKNLWVTTGFDYELRLLQYREHWAERSFTPGMAWDAFGCPDDSTSR